MKHCKEEAFISMNKSRMNILKCFLVMYEVLAINVQADDIRELILVRQNTTKILN